MVAVLVVSPRVAVLPAGPVSTARTTRGGLPRTQAPRMVNVVAERPVGETRGADRDDARFPYYVNSRFVLGEDEDGYLRVPAVRMRPWWKAEFSWSKPWHWPFYAYSRVRRGVAYIESGRP